MISQARRILGTAGHIDHGKTRLVRAISGKETDRLKEEQERGISIELGFAHHEIEGLQFGIVDVPGGAVVLAFATLERELSSS